MRSEPIQGIWSSGRPSGHRDLTPQPGFVFSVDPSHPNVIAPGKRPFHTLIASMAFRDGRPALLFGTMGGDGQPQTHMQVLSNLIDYGMDLQAAIEAPRWLHGETGPKRPTPSST